MESWRTTWLVALLVLVGGLRAEDIVFPPDAGVIDVRQSPYFAKGDGRTDDTEAIQQALLENGNANRIIYLSNGVYRISATLRWPGGGGGKAQRATILQGQSRDGVVIRLLDYTAGFNNAGRPRPMIWTGGDDQQHIRNAVRNLTLHTGVGNPGTTGLQFKANEQGCVRDVTIIAGGTGDGGTGLDLGHVDFNGPLLMKNIRVEGFDVGIRAAFSVFSMTGENLELVGQRSAAIRNSGQILSLRHVRSTNSVPALMNVDQTGMTTLMDSTLQGLPQKRTFPAIHNRGIVFVREISAPGYTNLVENRSGTGEDAAGPGVAEFFSHPLFNAFPAPHRTIRLPVEETPEVSWDPPSQWAGPHQFGGQPQDTRDDSAAIQAAVDSGATTIYLPNGTWVLRKQIDLKPSVRRVIGCEAKLLVQLAEGVSAFRVLGETNTPLVIERLEIEPSNRPGVEQASARPLVVSSCYGLNLAWPGKGDVFLEDVYSARGLEMGAGRRLWARQWSVAVQGRKLLNSGGTAWLLGFKSALGGSLIETENEGRTELLGGLCLSSGVWKTDPMFRITDASAAFIIGESSLNATPYQNIVVERRKQNTRTLTSSGLTADQPLPLRLGGIALPLYSGYDGVGNVTPRLAQPAGAAGAR
jgi:hypothetical protein